MTLSAELHNARGEKLSLGSIVGQGGEATVFELAGDPDTAVKRYHHKDEARSKKLRSMIGCSPADPATGTNHIAIAWPKTLVFDTEGDVAGFTMPLIDLKRSLPLHQLCHPKARRKRAPGISWHYLIRIARNLCAVVGALHDSGYVIGDLNESNVLVSDRGLVTLVDCDSVQVKQGGQIHHCGVGKAEFTAPDLQGKAFSSLVRTKSHDNFALAVLIFQLLMEGLHPFAGVYKGNRETPTLADNIRRRRSPYWYSPLATMPTTPPKKLLPPYIWQLWRSAFLARWRNRPSAKAWQRALERLEQTLVACTENPSHVYSDSSKHCPWCERVTQLGVEAFPHPGPAQSTAALVPSEPRHFQGDLRPWLAQLLISLFTLCILTTTLGLTLMAQNRAASTTNQWVAEAVALPLVFSLALSGLLIALIYRATIRSNALFVKLKRVESVVRTLFGATLFAVGGNLLIRFWAGNTAVLAKDWLLLPSLWVFGCGLFWWRLRKSWVGDTSSDGRTRQGA